MVKVGTMVMFSHIVLIILSILQFSYSLDDCVMQELITKEDAWDKKLHKDKMKDYHRREPPRNQSCVPVKVHFQLKTFAFDEYDGKFTAKVWTRLTWADERLTWQPEEFGGVSKMVVRRTDIWMPSLKLLNSVDPDYFNIEIGECTVFNDGEILCVPELIYESFCTSKLSDWPYDVQNCTLLFGDGDRFAITRFNFTERAMTLFPAEYGNGWNIMMMVAKTNQNTDMQLSFTLTLERQASGLVIILVGPCVILCVLTIITILLNVDDHVRFGLLCFSLLSHFVFLFAVSEFLPKHSGDTPVILFFIRDSITLSITSAIFTFILRKIVRRKTVPFEWASLISNSVFNSFGRYLIFPRWTVNSVSEDNNVKNKEVWINIANILNSVYLVVVIIVYICLFSVYMPKQPPAEY